MRRTTICRSDAARLAAAIVLLAGAGPLAAQQPPAIQRPIQQAQRAAEQARPAQPAQPQGQVQQPQQGQVPTAIPETHTVQEGETLWGLAQQFLGDPLLWPEIYRLNTDVVEDPHWIFPGEELRFLAPPEAPVTAPAPSGNVAVTPVADSTPQAPAQPRPVVATEGPTIFAGARQSQAAQASIELREERAYRAVREGEHFGAGFIADGSTIQAGHIVGGTESSALRRIDTRTTAALYSTVAVAPPSGEAYRRGDLLLAYYVARSVPPYGDLILPKGILRIAADGQPDRQVTATVVGLYDRVSNGDLLLKVPPFRYESAARAVPTDSGVVGTVIALRRAGEISNIQDVLYIDRGADDGIRLGDVIAISTAPSGDAPIRAQAEALVVHARPKTASVVLLQISQPDIRPGATARQIRRMPT